MSSQDRGGTMVRRPGRRILHRSRYKNVWLAVSDGNCNFSSRLGDRRISPGTRTIQMIEAIKLVGSIVAEGSTTVARFSGGVRFKAEAYPKYSNAYYEY